MTFFTLQWIYKSCPKYKVNIFELIDCNLWFKFVYLKNHIEIMSINYYLNPDIQKEYVLNVGFLSKP